MQALLSLHQSQEQTPCNKVLVCALAVAAVAAAHGARQPLIPHKGVGLGAFVLIMWPWGYQPLLG